MKPKSLFNHNTLALASMLLATVLLINCGQRQPIKEANTNNPEYNVQLLFEVDGCKVYRFRDFGSSRYFTICEGTVSYSGH